MNLFVSFLQEAREDFFWENLTVSCFHFILFRAILVDWIDWIRFFRWSARAIKSFAMGELEARKLKYPNTGTEALLMGILVEGISLLYFCFQLIAD